MSPKAKKAAAPAKATKAPKAEKSAKGGKSAELQAAPADGAVDTEELEEQEEAASSARASGGGGNAAALAAAGGTEMSASFKNFRHHPDMENFYRFIYENDLRHEALAIMDEMLLEKQNLKEVKFAKAQAH